MRRVGRGRGDAGGQLSVAYQQSAMAEPVFTRGDLVKNFPTSFSRAALEAHFSSEYVKVIPFPVLLLNPYYLPSI
jgi:hypothetical protein